MRPEIKKVLAIEKYKLSVSFCDGTEGVLDLSHLVGKGVFVDWEVQDHFFKVFINPESGAITWPGNIDIDTYNAYCKLKRISAEEYFQSKKIHAPHL